MADQARRSGMILLWIIIGLIVAFLIVATVLLRKKPPQPGPQPIPAVFTLQRRHATTDLASQRPLFDALGLRYNPVRDALPLRPGGFPSSSSLGRVFRAMAARPHQNPDPR